jgi:hypothetical protein
MGLFDGAFLKFLVEFAFAEYERKWKKYIS